MRMRLKLRRGEKISHKESGAIYTAIEESQNIPNFYRVLNDSGFILCVAKDELNIPTIDTKDYEKIA